MSQCHDLLSRVATILTPGVPAEKLSLPPLAHLLDGPAQPSFPDLDTAVSALDRIAEETKKILQLSHLLISRSIVGGLSGASVHIVEFRDAAAPLLQVGVLKMTTKRVDFERERDGMKKAQECWLHEYVAPQLRSMADGLTGYILSPLAFRATTERRIDSFHDLLTSGEKSRAQLVAKHLGQIYGKELGALVTTSSTRPSTPQQHFKRIWAPWRDSAVGFDWKRWGFPAREEQGYADGKRNWINPLACLDEIDCWKETALISLAWGWQHRDLNARNVLVAPFTRNSLSSELELRFIDLEKVSEASALLDLCWVSFWALIAGSEREPAIREQTWEQLPDAFIDHSLGMLKEMSGDAHHDCGIFQLSLDCIAEIFETMRAGGHLIGDPVMLYEMAALTMAGAGLAKSFYELRDLQRREEMDSRFCEVSWQKARCFFRIAARALEHFVVRPRGPFVTDISFPPLQQ
jgi:hypothetical protein